MRKIHTLICLLLSFSGLAQSFDRFSEFTAYDSLIRERNKVADDTNKVNVLNWIGNLYKFSRPDSGIYYASKGLALAQSLNFREGELYALHTLRLSYNVLGNYTTAYRIALEGLRKSEEYHSNQKAWFLQDLGGNMLNSKNYTAALDYYKKSYNEFKKLQEHNFVSISGAFLGPVYFRLGKLDSAFSYCYQAKQLAEHLNVAWVQVTAYLSLAELYRDLHNADSALYYFRLSNSPMEASGTKSYVLLEIARLFDSMNQQDSAAYYAEKSLDLALTNKLFKYIIDDAIFFSDFYEESDLTKALHYNKIALAYKDSLEAMSNMTGFADLLDFDEQQRKAELEKANEEYQSNLRTNIFLGSTFTLLVIAFFLYRNNRIKHKAKEEIEQAYNQLKVTQSQLIQAEKMASLGELTAGIAHEIQNPLNFVNNFSEVNTELIKEIHDKRQKSQGKQVVTEEDELLNNIADNLEKINHHGKRADSIVKSMMAHSRASAGQKEPTDINPLCDEYLRLAYHGLRAKDNSFNAEYKTELDPSVPKINVVPQEIGRVLLNLINNAFQAVAGASNPLVVVSTKILANKVEISVIDNGPGIPDNIKEKIFQPFFTTKPTGSGTGLGLSLSYDIVKAHGGAIRVVSSEGEGTEFIIQLPC